MIKIKVISKIKLIRKGFKMLRPLKKHLLNISKIWIGKKNGKMKIKVTTLVQIER